MMQRVVSALVVHETDPEQTPLRRGVGAVFASVMIAALVAAGFGVYGVVTGVGGDSWRADGAIVIERETGATFVYRNASLWPMLNFTSARLTSGNAAAEVHRVSGESLAGVPRQVTVGIPGAPDSLPAADRVVGLPWTLCSVVAEGRRAVTTTTLLVGDRLSGGAPLAESGMLVRDAADGSRYLLWHNHRYRITDDADGIIRSLFGFQQSITDVGSAWLNGLPAGQDIGSIEVPGLGAESDAVPGHEVGDLVYHAIGGGNQYYLVRSDGLAYLTELQMSILRGQYSVEPTEIRVSLANSVPVSDALAPPSGDTAPPAEPPQLVTVPDGADAICAETTDVSAPPTISVGGDTVELGGGIPTTGMSGTGVVLADQVLVPPGQVAVVRAMPSDDRGSAGSLHVVTDNGLRFPVPSDEVLSTLGYDPASATPVPAALVQRIPAGPTLDPGAALRPASQDSAQSR